MEHIRKTNRKLGMGSRGIVYEGYDEERGRFVAVKEIALFGGVCPVGAVTVDGSEVPCDEEPGVDEEMQAIVREISLMERVKHPNLVTYYGARRSAIGVQIIMEYVNGGSLDALIRRQGCLREGVVRSYTRDILEGLAYLHSTARVCHRDVKPANVLITADGHCKLTDFGVSKLIDDTVGMHTTVGTPWYMAPEVVDGDGNAGNETGTPTTSNPRRNEDSDSIASSGRPSYTTAADIWSLGVTVYEMISGRKPFGADFKNPAAVLFAIVSSNASPPSLPEGCEASRSLRDFLNLCFVRDARHRPNAQTLLNHEWFCVSPNTKPSKAPNDSAVQLATSLPLIAKRDMESPEMTSAARTWYNFSGSEQYLMNPSDLHLHEPPASVARRAGKDVERDRSAGRPSESGPTATQNSATTAEAEVGGSTFSALSCGDFGGGFWTSDGHYVDLISHAMDPPLNNKWTL